MFEKEATEVMCSLVLHALKKIYVGVLNISPLKRCLPTRWAFGFSGDQQQNIQCVLICWCCDPIRVWCSLLSVGNKVTTTTTCPPFRQSPFSNSCNETSGSIHQRNKCNMIKGSVATRSVHAYNPWVIFPASIEFPCARIYPRHCMIMLCLRNERTNVRTAEKISRAAFGPHDE